MTKIRNRVIVALWAVVAVVFAYFRSLWGDEYNHVQDLKKGLFFATNELLNKPSPFTPGEAVLNWAAKMLLWPINGPQEIWARLSGIAWGAATVYLALNYSRQGERHRYLPWFVAFSAPLMSLSTEMRPYASLLFSGALALKILKDRGIETRVMHALSWAMILFGHLYGICYLLFAIVVSGKARQEWKKIVGGVAIIALVLLRVKIVQGQGGSSMDGIQYVEILRQSLGILTNPHKAMVIVCPLFALGFALLLKRDRSFALKVFLLLFAAVIGPIYMTIKAKYFFVPRQVVGGSFVFLAVATEALEFLSGRLARFRPAFLQHVVPAALCVAASVVPWTLSTLLKIPPFPNQPFHVYREVSKEIAEKKWKRVLFLDPCNLSPMQEYLETALGEKAQPETLVRFAGMSIKQTCFAGSGLCMDTPADYALCSTSAETYGPGGSAEALVKRPEYEAILHPMMKPISGLPENAEVRRLY